MASEVKLLTTKCIIIETETIAKKAFGALTILKQFGIHQCNHKTPVTGSECLLSMIGKNNSHHYCVATQDRSLQDALREVPGVPLMYLHKKAPTLEKPSDASQALAESQKESCTITESQNAVLKTLKEKCGLPTTETGERRKKRKKKGGPNPLSCLKKKKQSKGSQKQTIPKSEGKIKKRVRVKLPAHVKQALSVNK